MNEKNTKNIDEKEDEKSLLSMFLSRSAWKNTRSNMMGVSYIKRGELLKGNLENVRNVLGKRAIVREAFEEAVERKGLTQNDLHLKRGTLIISSRLSYAFAILSFFVTLYLSINSHILSVFASASIFAFCVIGGWIRAYRAWQIEIRRFALLAEFTRTPEAWII